LPATFRNTLGDSQRADKMTSVIGVESVEAGGDTPAGATGFSAARFRQA